MTIAVVILSVALVLVVAWCAALETMLRHYQQWYREDHQDVDLPSLWEML